MAPAPARVARVLPFPSVLQGLIEASHPFPIAMVVALTLVVGLASSRGTPPLARLGVVAAAMFLCQLAIGWTNDYVDREADRRFQLDKPLARGLVAAKVLPPFTVAALAVGAILTATLLGAAPLAVLLLGTACGLAYDFGLKDTRFSALPFIAGFALLPPFVWISLDIFRGAFLWLYGVGPPLVLGVHLANSLPDVVTDRLAGRGGLAVRLGRRRSLQLLAVCLALAPALAALLVVRVDYDLLRLALTSVAFGFLCAIATVVYRGRPADLAAKRGFRVIAPAAVLFAAGWLAAV
jgi:4-hydroxybenzoate polyprenyltransferase